MAVYGNTVLREGMFKNEKDKYKNIPNIINSFIGNHKNPFFTGCKIDNKSFRLFKSNKQNYFCVEVTSHIVDHKVWKSEWNSFKEELSFDKILSDINKQFPEDNIKLTIPSTGIIKITIG